MTIRPIVSFGVFRLDATNAYLWRGSEKVPLKPKTFSVLCYLIERVGQLVTKEELLKTLWADVRVSDAVLKVCIREIREALDDHAKAPQFIETVHRRGYRFIAPLIPPPHSGLESGVQSLGSVGQQGAFPVSPLDPRRRTLDVSLVGRETELAQLHQWLVKAQCGERQIIFVTGEAGIGKTTVVEAFLDQLEGRANAHVSRAHCLEQYGEGEPYMPVLEALGQLCHKPGHERILEILSRYAPTWLVQMPSLLTSEAFETLQPRVLGTTKERMLRELAEALEALTAEQTLVLQFDDLHWSDSATLDLISYVARRSQPARLLIIGTSRLDDVERREYPLKPLKQDLRVHRYCEELTLAPLSETAVATYLTKHLTAPPPPQSELQRLTQMIHQHTEGNPLFMVSLVDYVTSQAVPFDANGNRDFRRTLEHLEIPLSLRAFLEHQISKISEKAQHVLQTASIAGREFSAAAVAAGREESIDTVELVCEELARQSLFLQRRGTDEWPDGTVAARYRFLHVLHQNVLAESMTTRQRITQHRRVGERLETAYGTRVQEIAAELALRFEEGRDYNRALQYRWQAGTNATRRHAHQEAIIHFTRALDLLASLPDAQERKHLELGLRIVLGGSLVTAKGHAAPEVEAVYAEARRLCQEVGDTPQLFPALAGLYRHYVVRGKYDLGRTLGNQLLHLAQRTQESTLLMGAHGMLGYVLFLLGDFSVAQEHLEQSIALYDVPRHRSIASLYGDDPGVASLAFAAWTLWLRGYPDQALQRNNAALLLAHEVAHPHVHATALGLSAQLHRFRREDQTVEERSADVLALAAEYGFPLWIGAGTVSRGWALGEQGMIEEGISQIHQGLLTLRDIGSESQRPHYLGLLAELYGKGGRPQIGLTLTEEALSTIDKTGERFWEAELYRLKGNLVSQSRAQSAVPKNSSTLYLAPYTQAETEAEACFLKAIEIARQQEAKSLELRATVCLARLWQRQDKHRAARNTLSTIYHWFTEGFETTDLREAKKLLDELTDKAGLDVP